ncbi:MAG TPA: cytochrome c peroxidase [Cellvibrionaceae bacterium]
MINNLNLLTMRPAGALTFCICLLVAGCGGDSNQPSDGQPRSTLDHALRAEIELHQLTGDPSLGRNLPSIEDPKAQLGMQLFYTKALSGDLDTACVTCHHPMLGGGDALSLSIGVDAESPDILGMGRVHSTSGEHYDGGPSVPRNAPTTFNLALWDKVLFHDGRVESLSGTPGMNGADGSGIRTPDVAFAEADPEAGTNLSVAQARFPVTSPEEMKNFGWFEGISNQEVRQYLQERLGDYGLPPGGPLAVNHWPALFAEVYGTPGTAAEDVVTFANIADALAAYENSQVFVDTPWKKYVQGDEQALTAAQKRGALLFYRSIEQGGANCAGCHGGDFFTDEQFHNTAMLQVGRGKGDGDNGTEDFGRYRETGQEKDRYAFRTPSLINVAATGPWGHAGAYTSLEGIVRQQLHPEQMFYHYDWSQLDPTVQTHFAQDNTQRALDHWLTQLETGESQLQPVSLNDTQVADLVAFMHALTDPCVLDRACMSPWIPDEYSESPDDLRLDGMDEYGNYW